MSLNIQEFLSPTAHFSFFSFWEIFLSTQHIGGFGFWASEDLWSKYLAVSSEQHNVKQKKRANLTTTQKIRNNGHKKEAIHCCWSVLVLSVRYGLFQVQPRNLGANITSSDPPADPHILTKYDPHIIRIPAILTKYDPQRPGSPASILHNSHKDTSFYPLAKPHRVRDSFTN